MTEPTYFEDLKKDLQISLVEIIVNDQGGVPKTLVERAVQEKKAAAVAVRRERDSNLAFEEIWCVYDVDSHPKLLEARQQADAHGIRLAISNPSFELWFLLHFQDQRAHIERADARAACKKHMSGYIKRATFRVLSPNYDLAKQRAHSLELQHERDNQPGANPSTGVVHLTEKLREHSRAEHLKRIAAR